MTVYEHYTRVGLHSYFRQFDLDAFDHFGGREKLDRSGEPYHWTEFGRAPWKQAQLVGFFATLHGILIGIGLGILTISALDMASVPVTLWWYLIIPIGFGGIAFLLYLYWLAADVRSRHIAMSELYERVCREPEQVSAE